MELRWDAVGFGSGLGGNGMGLVLGWGRDELWVGCGVGLRWVWDWDMFSDMRWFSDAAENSRGCGFGAGERQRQCGAQ